ncbi:MAG: hypothetical protein AB1346_10605, partial [Thermodesulfobacteriota bacterium]
MALRHELAEDTLNPSPVRKAKSVPLWLPALLAVLLWAGFAFAWSFAVTGDSHDDGEETFRA